MNAEQTAANGAEIAAAQEGGHGVALTGNALQTIQLRKRAGRGYGIITLGNYKIAMGQAGASLEPVADASHLGGTAEDAEGHISAQTATDLPQGKGVQIGVEQGVERTKNGGGVGRAARKPGTFGDHLLDVDTDAARMSGIGKKGARGAAGKIGLAARQRRIRAGEADAGQTVAADRHLVAQSDGVHGALQIMVAVGSQTHDLKI